MNFSQHQYFTKLEQELQLPIVPWLQDVLNVSYMAARRLVSGETELKAVHLLAITSAFPEAVEQTTTLLKGTQMRIMYRRSFGTVAEFSEYLKVIEGLLKNALNHDNAKLYYSARDLPLFAFLKERNMLTFKVRLWCRELKQSGLAPLPAPVYRQAEELIHMYREIRSEEIWDIEAVSIQCRQLRHFLDTQTISKTEYDILMEELRRILFWITTYVKNEQKGSGAEFRLWHASYLSLNNAAAFVFGDQHHTIYTTGHAKFLSTSNAEAYQDFRADWKQHLQYAKPVTHSSVVNMEEGLERLSLVEV